MARRLKRYIKKTKPKELVFKRRRPVQQKEN
jgi:hypothetical protein